MLFKVFTYEVNDSTETLVPSSQSTCHHFRSSISTNPVLFLWTILITPFTTSIITTSSFHSWGRFDVTSRKGVTWGRGVETLMKRHRMWSPENLTGVSFLALFSSLPLRMPPTNGKLLGFFSLLFFFANDVWRTFIFLNYTKQVKTWCKDKKFRKNLGFFFHFD